MNPVADNLVLAQAFEALMLVCFGLAWPINALHMLRSKQPQGKGLCFTLIVWCGYLAGTIAKLLWTVGAGEALPAVFWLYVLNTVTVGFNVWLYGRYRRHGRGAAATPPGAGLESRQRRRFLVLKPARLP